MTASISTAAALGENRAASAAPERNAIEIRNLNFYYGQFQGLKNVSLDIPERRVTAFIGPSGCGKSTLLRTLNRMYSLYPGQRAEGEIRFDGRNILDPDTDLNLLRARIGMVFQKPTPFPMTIYENIAFGVRLYEKLSKSDMDDRVEWALTKAVSEARWALFGEALWAVYDLYDIAREVGPPIEPIRRAVTPGRNDPCPCGSGKKYKKCCGAA